MTTTIRCPSCGTPTENDLCQECDDQAAYWDNLTDEQREASVAALIAHEEVAS